MARLHDRCRSSPPQAASHGCAVSGANRASHAFPQRSSAVPRHPKPIPKTNYIDLEHGKFSIKTGPQDLIDAFADFKSSKKNHLCVFFHGGLVGRASAQKQAATLIDGYAKAGAYPFFFIWNSDLLTTLGRRLSPFDRNDVFRRVIEQHLR